MTITADAILLSNKGRRATEGPARDKKCLHGRNIPTPPKVIPVSTALSK